MIHTIISELFYIAIITSAMVHVMVARKSYYELRQSHQALQKLTEMAQHEYNELQKLIAKEKSKESPTLDPGSLSDHVEHWDE